ncbi:MAG: hypothetical protein A4E66_01531 [Syntrophus sp. PtaB.Bin001]|nr:MAG: hypothetical protein A4E66_01531 [Syntrophus sp. PtaB.Bin001]
MNIGAKTLSLTDKIAFLHTVFLLYKGLARSAEMLKERNFKLLRQGHLLNSQMFGDFFGFWGMNPPFGKSQQ